MEGRGWLKSVHGGAWGFKMLSKNTCEGVTKTVNLLKLNFFIHIFQRF